MEKDRIPRWQKGAVLGLVALAFAGLSHIYRQSQTSNKTPEQITKVGETRPEVAEGYSDIENLISMIEQRASAALGTNGYSVGPRGVDIGSNGFGYEPTASFTERERAVKSLGVRAYFVSKGKLPEQRRPIDYKESLEKIADGDASSRVAKEASSLLWSLERDINEEREPGFSHSTSYQEAEAADLRRTHLGERNFRSSEFDATYDWKAPFSQRESFFVRVISADPNTKDPELRAFIEQAAEFEEGPIRVLAERMEKAYDQNGSYFGVSLDNR